MAGKRENVQKREFLLEPWQEPILKGRRMSRGGVPDMLQWGFPLHKEMRFHGLTLKHRVAREYNCTVAFRSRASDGICWTHLARIPDGLSDEVHEDDGDGE